MSKRNLCASRILLTLALAIAPGLSQAFPQSLPPGTVATHGSIRDLAQIKVCKKGKPCGNGCIAQDKTCTK